MSSKRSDKLSRRSCDSAKQRSRTSDAGGVLCIPRSRWDFSRECPSDELEECRFYEAARRSVFWPVLFSTLHEAGGWKNFEIGQPEWRRLHRILSSFSEFPSVPWLEIAARKRREVLQSLRSLNLQKQTCIADYIPETFPIPDLDSEEKCNGPYWEDNGPEILSRYRDLCASNAGQKHPIRIAWQFSDAVLVKEFKEWLKRTRPKVFQKQQGKKPPLREDVLRASLRALGTLGVPKGFHQKMITLHEQIRIRPLYPTKSELSTNRKRAEAIVASVEPGYISIHPNNPAANLIKAIGIFERYSVSLSLDKATLIYSQLPASRKMLKRTGK